MAQTPNDSGFMNGHQQEEPRGLLNESLGYDAVATEESRALFLGGRPAYREALHTGLLLCRFQPRTWSPQRACPWWILFQSFRLSNGQTMGGLADFLAAKHIRIDAEGQLVAAEELKISCREAGSRFTLVRLIRSVYGFMGPTAPQRPEPCGGMMPLRGGEFRVWIPGLRAHDLQFVAVPEVLRAERRSRQQADEQDGTPTPDDALASEEHASSRGDKPGEPGE